MSTTQQFDVEVAKRERFRFGKNWQRFLSVLTEERNAAAEASLRDMLQVQSLQGKTFLDIGSGSGLFSLAAMRLGAAQVCSFDFDPQSVECTGRELKSRYFSDSPHWTITSGSVLDPAFLRSLGTSMSFTRGAYCITRAKCGKPWKTSCLRLHPRGSCSLRSTTIWAGIAPVANRKISL